MADRVLPAFSGAAVAAALVFPAPWRWLAGLAALAGLSLFYRRVRRGRKEAAAAAEELRAEAGGLAERGSLQAALLEVLPVGVMAQRDGRTVFANRMAAEVLGGRVMEEGAPLPREVREALAAAAAGEFAAREFERHPGRVIQVTAHPSESDDLQVAAVEDVTERRRAETMNRDFVTAASHELENPGGGHPGGGGDGFDGFGGRPGGGAGFHRAHPGQLGPFVPDYGPPAGPVAVGVGGVSAGAVRFCPTCAGRRPSGSLLRNPRSCWRRSRRR